MDWRSNAVWQQNRLYQDERPTGPPDEAPSSSSAALQSLLLSLEHLQFSVKQTLVPL